MTCIHELHKISYYKNHLVWLCGNGKTMRGTNVRTHFSKDRNYITVAAATSIMLLSYDAIICEIVYTARSATILHAAYVYYQITTALSEQFN